MHKKINDVMVIGFALFAMFFGAGNLIFPPYIGFQLGDKWFLGLMGFMLTGIGLPLLGIITMAQHEGSFENFAGKVGKAFASGLYFAIVLCIGPLLAIPRTGATTYEMGIAPIMPDFNILTASVIYFAINIYFTINRSKVIDNIGKILTPSLLLMLAVIIIKGIIAPVGSFASSNISNAFGRSFSEGYQTMDALASIVFAGIIINAVKERVYEKAKEKIKLTIISGLIAALGLLFVYGGLMYLGATASTLFDGEIGKTALLISIVEKELGSFGKVALGLAVSLACLTTSVGLTATSAEYFSRLTKNKISYKAMVVIISLFSALIGAFGVEKIIKFSVPILVSVYPVVIVLILMNAFSSFIKNERCYAYAAIFTLLISIVDGLSAAGLNLNKVYEAFYYLPFVKEGFAWVYMAMFGIMLGMIHSAFNKKLEKENGLK
ncbi:MAG: branched-chain amino acid:cation transporter, family [Tepidanaerobacteraceae bacterium]|nr:branched-chain amino acid:cation transporter, family [Tepidanaerobacteraceae bacterium]